jgi:hypothetical protein
MQDPSTSLRYGPQWFRTIPMIPAAERPPLGKATGTAPTPPLATNFLMFILLFLSLLVFFLAYLFILHVHLYHSVGVPWTLYTHPTTLTSGPDS